MDDFDARVVADRAGQQRRAPGQVGSFVVQSDAIVGAFPTGVLGTGIVRHSASFPVGWRNWVAVGPAVCTRRPPVTWSDGGSSLLPEGR